MFEIRIICDPTDTERVTAKLTETFTTGAVRKHPTRDGKRTRLYVTAEHQENAHGWPTPEQAYALAPSIVSEIGWTARAAAEKPFGETLGREFWLRKAALLDRIALDDATASVYTDAPELALNAARKLLNVDRDGDGNYGGTPYWPDHPKAIANPRGYVRQEYALWTKHQ
ncbi:hypothetical protein ACFUJR_03665 [Streptomyces sp. NPDC057271]|uniref:hypothetical protein n=1 Tax=unclassified Streptomyces TaxID=2593676 RepID=UPI0036422380